MSMEATADVQEVTEVQGQSGATRYVLTTSTGDTYTTFKAEIARHAKQFEGQRVRIQYHETQRGRYRNIYLDSVEPLGRADAQSDEREEEHRVEEAAWETALEAAPWLLGGRDASRRKVQPQEFFDRLKPFKDLVANDIKDDSDEG